MSFDWQTEEVVDWDDPLQPKKEPQVPRRRWPWGVLVLLLLLATAVFVIVREVGQRVEVATQGVEDDLLASVTVIQNAAVAADEALFRGFLSGRDADWVRASEQLVADDLYLQRPAFGLQWIEIEPETTVISSTLSPEFNAAEVLLHYAYAVDIGNGLTDTVELQQTAVYRLGEDRWLLAPPEPEFWGEAGVIETSRLTAHYFERDEKIVQKVAADLAVEWTGICSLLRTACSSDFGLEIEFSTDPATLREAVVDFDWQNDVQHIQLPTPTLVGIPQDQDGYDLLYAGYVAQILRPYLWATFSQTCCEGELLYEAAIDQFLRQIGVWSVTDTAVEWETLNQNLGTLQQANYLWGTAEFSPQNRQLANAILAFLVNELDIPPVEILRTLATTEEQSLSSYLVTHFEERLAAHLWEREWRQFGQQKSAVSVEREQLPAHDLLLLCQPDWANKVALYRHDLSADTTQLVQDFNYAYNDGFMIGLPDQAGLGMSGMRNDGTIESFLLRDNVRYDLTVDEGANDLPFMRPVSRQGTDDYMLWFTFAGPVADGLPFGILDVSACLDDEQCQVQMGSSYPVWSPNGKRMVAVQMASPFGGGADTGGLISSRSADGKRLMGALGLGSTPFWLDENRIGYVQSLADGRSQVFVTNIAGNEEPELLLKAQDFVLALPQVNEALFVDFAQLDPNDPTVLLLMMGYAGGNEYGRVLLAYDLETEMLETRWTLDSEPTTPPDVYQFSPDGQWLLTSRVDENATSWDLLLHHLQSGATITMPMDQLNRWPNLLYGDWSANSAWLTMPQHGMIQLFAPDTGLKHMVIADELFCTNAVWVDDE